MFLSNREKLHHGNAAASVKENWLTNLQIVLATKIAICYFPA
ncbi:hypothetical protein HMPREF0880_03770 [Yokenella regensburgei ATCC 43003]|nr:hypothetical protein HMPREF0880_03770 [Yokenella regensburgei ATCC 43003]